MMNKISNFARPAVSVLLAIALSVASVAPIMAAAVACEELVMQCEMSSPCCCAQEAAVPDGGAAFATTPSCECAVSESGSLVIPPLRASLQRTDAGGALILKVQTPGSTSVIEDSADLSTREGPPDYNSPPLFLTSCSFLI